MSLQARFKKLKEDPAPATPTNGSNGVNHNGVPLLLNLKQSAAYLGLPLKQIRKLVAAHNLKRAPVATKGFVIAREELDRYAREMFKSSFFRDIRRVAVFGPAKKRKSKARLTR
jgi:hypothetical protein